MVFCCCFLVLYCWVLWGVGFFVFFCCWFFICVFSYTSIRSLWAFLIQAEQSQLCLYSYDRCFCSLIIFVALHWTHSSMSVSLWKLDPELLWWPHKCWAEGKDHLTQPAGNTPTPNAAQDSMGLCCKGMLLAHVQLCVHQHPALQSCFPVRLLFSINSKILQWQHLFVRKTFCGFDSVDWLSPTRWN